LTSLSSISEETVTFRFPLVKEDIGGEPAAEPALKAV
jgi:hypothetical protein